MTFVKSDAGKARFDLIPPEALESMARALAHGAAKYGADNWRQCDDPVRYFAAMQRHVWAWKAGEEIDAESGNPHLDHAIASLAMLIALKAGGK